MVCASVAIRHKPSNAAEVQPACWRLCLVLLYVGAIWLPAILFMCGTYKSADHGFTVWIAVSRAAESEREEGVYLLLYLPLVPRCCLAICPLALSLSLPPLRCIATLLCSAGSATELLHCTDTLLGFTRMVQCAYPKTTVDL